MKRFLSVWLLMLLAMSTHAGAQVVKKYYTSHVVDGGLQYHLFAQNLFSNESYGDLSCDVTYQTRDRGKATLSFTYHTPTVIHADSIYLIAAGHRVSLPIIPIYIDRGRTHWDHRYTCQVALSDLQRFYASDSDPEMWVWVEGSPVVYRAKPAEWKQYTASVGTIFQKIRKNEP